MSVPQSSIDLGGSRPCAACDARNSRGFTLIELVIALSIVAILAVIAIPSYRGYVLRGNRAVARKVLIDLAAKQEAQSLKTGGYAQDFGFIGLSGTTYSIDNKSGATTSPGSTSIYTIAMTGISTTAYTLTATAVNQQLADSSCLTLTLTSIGVKTAVNSSGVSNPDCWNR